MLYLLIFIRTTTTSTYSSMLIEYSSTHYPIVRVHNYGSEARSSQQWFKSYIMAIASYFLLAGLGSMD